MQQNSCSREAASEGEAEKPGGVRWGRERPECSQGNPACALLLASARTRPQRPETPSSVAEAPEAVKRPLAPRGRRTSPGAARPRPGQSRRRTRGPPPGLAGSLPYAHRALAIRPGLAFTTLGRPIDFPPGLQCEEVGMSLKTVRPFLCPATDDRRRGGRKHWPGSWLPAAPRLSWPGECVAGQKPPPPPHNGTYLATCLPHLGLRCSNGQPLATMFDLRFGGFQGYGHNDCI